MDHSKAVYITDMGACTPAAALSAEHRKYRWQTVPYEAEGVSGTMIYSGPETDTPPVTLPLGVSGWHAVFLGLYSNIHSARLKARLTGDRGYTWFEREESDTGSTDPVYSGPSAGRVDSYALDERFWKYADLTAQDVTFAADVANSGPSPAYVAYVKLVPLSDAEVAAVQADRAPDAETKRLILMNDAFSEYISLPHHDPRQTIWDWLEPYRDTDFKTLLWCACQGDAAHYPSRVAPIIGSGTTDFPRDIDRTIHESITDLAGRGVDALYEVIEFCHEAGIQVHVSNRMESFQCSPPFEEFFTGRFYTEHPEWRCVDIDGREIARMSYAYEGVRDLMLNMFKEATDKYDADGVNPIFNRGAPFLLYEQPLLDGFEAETGQDARQLAEDDERYLRYRAGVMTDFMRALRRELDAIGEKKGRKLEVSAHVLSNEQTNLFYGLDVPTWIEEGLIDNLISYPWRDVEPDVAYFGSLTKGTPVKFYPEVMPRRMPPEEYRLRGIDNYAAGADGMCFWDTNGRDQMRKEWSMLRRLGHKDDLGGWDDGEGKFWRSRKMISVGGYVLDKYPPHWAF
jgi:hypothetical protein